MWNSLILINKDNKLSTRVPSRSRICHRREREERERSFKLDANEKSGERAKFESAKKTYFTFSSILLFF